MIPKWSGINGTQRTKHSVTGCVGETFPMVGSLRRRHGWGPITQGAVMCQTQERNRRTRGY